MAQTEVNGIVWILDDIQLMTGIGHEHLIVNGVLVAKFFNGNLVRETV
jgi:hypothetical protein